MGGGKEAGSRLDPSITEASDVVRGMMAEQRRAAEGAPQLPNFADVYVAPKVSR